MSEEKEYFGAFPAFTVLPWIVWAVVIGLVIGGVLYASKVQAEPRFQVIKDDVTITLFDEPCELKDQVTNLPYKTTWQEKGQTFQGCWAARPDVESVVAFFSDKTVALIPFQAFKKVVGV